MSEKHADPVNWPKECGIVVPCLNEAGFIARVICEARAHLDTVVVVDDGSIDDSGVLAASAGAIVLRHAFPRGKGAALRTGLSWLNQQEFTWALLMDGDGQHAAADIPRFLHQAETAPAVALIAGNRMHHAKAMPLLRRAVNRWMSARLSRLTQLSLPDSQCGFRLVRLSVWANLPLQTDHFEVESEMLLTFLRAGLQVNFVPVQVIYGNEKTKVSPMLDSWRWCRWLMKATRAPWPARRLD